MTNDFSAPSGARSPSAPAAAVPSAQWGRVTLVGAGPGDAELLTLKAARVLASASTVLYDNLVSNDVLAHVAYAELPLTRDERADRAMAVISENFNPKQRVFLDFVLSHYVAVGVEELDQAKLTPLLKLKYHDSISDAVADLGKPEEIGKVFSGFQKYLYVEAM